MAEGGDNTAIGPPVRRSRVKELWIHEITEDELNKLARGGVDSIFLNFFIFFASVCISFIIALGTAKIEPDWNRVVFICVALITGSSALVMFVLWLWYRGDRSQVVKGIRNRIPPPEGTQGPLAPIEES